MTVLAEIARIIIILSAYVMMFLAGGLYFLKRAENEDKRNNASPYTYHIVITIYATNQAIYAANRRLITNAIDQICSPMNVHARVSASLLWDQSEEATMFFSEDMCVTLYCSSETEFTDIYHRIRSRCEKYVLQIFYGEGLR